MALEEKWIPKKHQKTASKYYIAYVTAKNHADSVDLLIPKDDSSVKILSLLMSAGNRRQAEIPIDNRFVFSSTKGSLNHVSAYHDYKHVLTQANTPNLNATRTRHYLATELMDTHPTSQEHAQFSKHLGHSTKIDETIYQCPPAVKTISVVGGFLSKMDARKNGKLI